MEASGILESPLLNQKIGTIAFTTTETQTALDNFQDHSSQFLKNIKSLNTVDLRKELLKIVSSLCS